VKRPLWLVCTALAAAFVAGSAGAGPAAYRCTPTVQDAFGPFGRGMPPRRATIGRGHVTTGVVLSALTCRPLRNAQVQYWQVNRNGRYTRAGSGTILTNREGRFRFQGPFPPSYEGREGHIHLRVIAKNYVPLLARYVPPVGERLGTIRLVLVPEDL
jgi:protocatechuate 3,4-dioxygenase beta subunit